MECEPIAAQSRSLVQDNGRLTPTLTPTGATGSAYSWMLVDIELGTGAFFGLSTHERGRPRTVLEDRSGAAVRFTSVRSRVSTPSDALATTAACCRAT